MQFHHVAQAGLNWAQVIHQPQPPKVLELQAQATTPGMIFFKPEKIIFKNNS